MNWQFINDVASVILITEMNDCQTMWFQNLLADVSGGETQAVGFGPILRYYFGMGGKVLYGIAALGRASRHCQSALGRATLTGCIYMK